MAESRPYNKKRSYIHCISPFSRSREGTHPARPGTQDADHAQARSNGTRTLPRAKLAIQLAPQAQELAYNPRQLAWPETGQKHLKPATDGPRLLASPISRPIRNYCRWNTAILRMSTPAKGTNNLPVNHPYHTRPPRGIGGQQATAPDGEGKGEFRPEGERQRSGEARKRQKPAGSRATHDQRHRPGALSKNGPNPLRCGLKKRKQKKRLS